MPPPRLRTIGHSDHPMEVFLELLATAGVEQVVDVRRFPGSRHNPQFGSEALAASLAAGGLGYEHLPSLGGRRRPSPDSPHTGWRVAAFRGYADHLRTPEFAEGRAELERLARERPSAVMCAEAVPWRCHRRLIADVFVFAGWCVEDVMPDGRLVEHVPLDFAELGEDGLPAYPAPA